MTRPSPRPAAGSRSEVSLDDVDRALLRVLATDARITNQALAERVGIAPSTCLMRVRRLQETRVITGFRADIAPDALGRGLQALILVHLQADARRAVGTFATRLAELPGVLDVLFLGGVDDFQMRVAVHSAEELRDLVADVSSLREVANTQTNIIFERRTGTHPLA